MSKSVLKIRDLHTAFRTDAGTVEALRGVTIDLYDNEILGIVGESGSGKSVLMKSLLRILPQNGSVTKGEVYLGEKRIDNLRESEMNRIRGGEIAMIFQDPMTSLNPLRTIGYHLNEVIDRFHKGKSNAEKRKIAVNTLTDVGIANPSERLKQYPHEFSGGMRQRAAIAMAVSANPKILIADEPTTALDVTIQMQILDLLQSLQAQSGKSMILITHDLGVVAGRCDRVVVLYGGMVMEQGPVDEIFYHSHHPYTRALLEAIPHIEEEREKRLRTIPGIAPTLSELGDHCPFAFRCAYSDDICFESVPLDVQVKAGHLSKCHFAIRFAEEPKRTEESNESAT